MIIGIDLDGVLFDLIANCKEVYHAEGLITEAQRQMELTEYDFWNQWGMDVNVFWENFAQFVTDGKIFWDSKYLMGDPVDALLELAEVADLYLVTARNIPNCINSSRSATHHWLYDALGPVPWAGVIVSNDKTVISADVFFEDSVDNMKALLDAGTLAVCINRPWNEGWPGHSIDSIEEAPAYIENLLRGATSTESSVGDNEPLVEATV